MMKTSTPLPLRPLSLVALLALAACGKGAATDFSVSPDEQATETSSAALSEGNPNPGIAPVNSSAHGKTYGEWLAEHWQWTYSMPQTANPNFDTADCSAGQSGHVWFLAGIFTNFPVGKVHSATRDCTVPTGTALFFPIVDVESATAEGNGTTEAELRTNSTYLMDHATDLSCEIDGVPVKDLLANYRVQSPLFTWGPLPADSFVSDPTGAVLPAGTKSPSVAEGVALLLNPLSAGSHTIHFAGSVVFTLANDGFDFTFALDITYHLHVGK
jgi:hypothetical protein